MPNDVVKTRKARENMGMNTNSINHLYLAFDGSTSGGNPGAGGCGAVCSAHENINVESCLFQEFRHLGIVTSNVAEYLGLIAGLRRILQEYPMLVFDLTVSGDSNLVIRQMTGEYNVNASHLLPLYHVAKGLVGKIKGDVHFQHVPRKDNQRCDALAKHAATTPAPVGEFIVFYPSLMSLLEGNVNGRPLVVGNDVGTAGLTPEVLFDATTILEIFGSGALEKLTSPGKTTQVRGKTNFTVLGVLSFPITFSVMFQNGPIQLRICGVVVVDSLPYDVQLSVDHPQVQDTGWGIGISSSSIAFDVSSVPRRFQQHPYWQSDRIFVAGTY